MMGLIFFLLMMFFMPTYSSVFFGLVLVIIIFFMILGMGVNDFLGYWMGLDFMSFFLVFLSFWVVLLMYYTGFSLDTKGSGKFYYAVEISILFFLTMTFSVFSMFMFYLFFEVTLIMIFFMILSWGSQEERLSAGLYMFFYTMLGSLPFLFMFMVKMLEDGWVKLIDWEVSSFFGWQWFFVLLVFFVKLPMFFLHYWLPSAHVEAPVTGSMILAGVLLKLGGYGIYRLVPFFLGEMSFVNYIIVLGVIGGVYSSFYCLLQTDLKALIAYSSVGHMGLFLSGVMSGSGVGYNGGMLMMVGHGFCSSGLFCLINMFYERVHSRMMMLLKGVMVMLPGSLLMSFLLISSNMSSPFSLILFSELYISIGLWYWSKVMVLFLFFLYFLTGAYNIYLFVGLGHGGGWNWFYFNQFSVRENFLVLAHWAPLNFAFLGLDMLVLY